MDAEGTPFGRYRLIELLGRGGMGEVWRAHDTVTDRVVAIKVLPANLSEDADFQRRFRREAHAAARLDTPHVVPIHDYGEIDGRLFVSMRLIKGRDLDTVLADGPLGPARAVRIIDQVAKALHAAHEVGLIHRDIKPSNILLDRDDFAYLIDFGIARVADETRLTKSGNTIGTFAYIAPERLDPRVEEDARADIYSLACVLYEALTGQPPFAGTTTAHLIAAHLNAPAPRPSSTQHDVPPQVDDVIATGMAKDPAHRYATTIELADAARDAITVPIPQPAQPHTESAPSFVSQPTVIGHRPPPLSNAPAPAVAPRDYPSPRLPSGAREQTTSKRPSRSTKVALAVCAAVAVLTVLVIGFNMFGKTTQGVQVPDVRGQLSADAITFLQSKGFKTRTQQQPDSSIPPDHVVGTQPAANASVSAGGLITVDVSIGPDQRSIPDVTSLSYADAVSKLQAAGFSKVTQTTVPSVPEMKDKVVGTNPQANQRSATTSVITVIVGSGPEAKQIPDVAGQTVDLAQKTLLVYGFTKITQTQVDSPRPAGEVTGTNPPKGQAVPVDQVIELQVSKGSQFVMPDLSGKFWTDAEPQLRALGWTGTVERGPDVDAGPAQRNRIVSQTPPAGAGANRDGIVTLRFGQ